MTRPRRRRRPASSKQPVHTERLWIDVCWQAGLQRHARERGARKVLDQPGFDLNALEYGPRLLGKVIRDPIHDYIKVPTEILPIVNHPFFQRLRRVGQTSMSSTVFPSMNGQRFEHSLGAMHLAIRGWESAWNNAPRVVRAYFRKSVLRDLGAQLKESDIEKLNEDLDSFKNFVATGVAAAAVLHDIGHPPFSHTLEDFYRGNLDWVLRDCPAHVREKVYAKFADASSVAFHEVVGSILVSRMQEELRDCGVSWILVNSIMSNDQTLGAWDACLHDLISGEVDVDRMDYLMRDRYNSGTEFGVFDKERLVQSLELHLVTDGNPNAGDSTSLLWAIGYGMRAASALEALIHGRFNYYRWVVYHYHTVAANRFLNLAITNLIKADSSVSADGSVLAPLDAAHLNYFASSADFSTSESINLAIPDDATVICWLKDRSVVHRNSSISGGSDPAHQQAYSDLERARERFMSLADIVLFRSQHWCSLWDSEWSYRMLSERIHDRLVLAISSTKMMFEQWTESKDSSWSQQIKYRRSVFSDLEYAISNNDFTMAGPVPLMNKLAEHLFGTASSGGQVRIQREIRESERFATVATPIEGHSKGFWVFAHNTMKPWQDDGFQRWGSQIFAGNSRRALVGVSGPALRELPNREAERVQFHCFFVDPVSNGGLKSTSVDRIRASFERHYPNYVYNSLLQFSH